MPVLPVQASGFSSASLVFLIISALTVGLFKFSSINKYCAAATLPADVDGNPFKSVMSSPFGTVNPDVFNFCSFILPVVGSLRTTLI